MRCRGRGFVKVRNEELIVVYYLSHQILVFDHAQVPACSLGDPLPCYQVTQNNRSWTYADCISERGREKCFIRVGSKCKDRSIFRPLLHILLIPGCFWRGLGRLVTHV